MIKDYRPAKRIPTWEQVNSLLIDLEERKEYLSNYPFQITDEGMAMFSHYVKEIRSIGKLVEAIESMNFYKPKLRSQRAI
jgi:hypothetical protein